MGMAIGRYLDRIRRDVAGALMLLRAGVRPWSIALYPIRRRLRGARSQLDLRGGLSVIAPADEPLLFLFKEIWVERRYDAAPLERDGAVVDVGAHVGLFTLWALSQVPDLRVVALEPSPRAAAYLRANVRRNGLRTVEVVEAACGGSRRRAALYPGRAEMQSTLHPTATISGHPQEVEVLTLDDVFAGRSIDRCQLLKLDCEGAEYEILFGAGRDTLARIDRIVMECHMDRAGCDPQELAEHLRSQGFDLRWSPSDGVHAYVYASRVAPGALLPLDAGIDPTLSMARTELAADKAQEQRSI